MTGAAPLDRLAEAYGLQLSWLSEDGRRLEVADRVKRAVLQAMGVAAEDDASVAKALETAPQPVDSTIAAPRDVHCYMPAWLRRGRAWGVTCQLYGLRSSRNHGIGDFADLADLAERVGAVGGDFLGVNPLHALFTADPDRCSPFSPSNRRFLNPLYIALDRVPGVDPGQAVAAAGARDAPEIDYGSVGQAKLAALRAAWRAFPSAPNAWPHASQETFARFVRAYGEALNAHARFEALSHHMVAAGHGAGWHGWPAEYRDARSQAVAEFAAAHEDEVGFHLWLQWLADVQLADAAQRARAAGMRVGFYLDFAVGTAPDGSATWHDPGLVVPDASIGVPPDPFFLAGQNWGLAPLAPSELRARRLAPYRAIVGSAFRHAGAVRIDHAMSLHRLYWIPHGMGPAEGCYVRYPLADMVRALAAVSQESGAIVIGEDLGTVSAGFRELMRDVGMLSYQLLYFEHTRSGFRAARSFRRNAFVAISSHDLPPFASWWAGDDIGLYGRLGQLDRHDVAERDAQRVRDRHGLVERLQREAARRPFRCDIPDAPETTELRTVTIAVHAHLARTPCRLFGIQFEDLCGARAPVNVPGTHEEYPNWRLRAPATIDAACRSGLWTDLLAAVAAERPCRR